MNPIMLLETVLVLALIGFIVYLIITYIPMPEMFKQVLMVVVAILIILWLQLLRVRKARQGALSG